MSQSYVLTGSATGLRDATVTHIPNAFEALRSLFSGDVEPAAPIAHQLWHQPSTGTLWQRNAANSAWLAQKRREVVIQAGALSARTWRALRCAVPILVESVAVLPSGATSTSVAASKEWTFLLKNQTTGLNLFSATPSTATTVSGVGGGELAADTAKVLTTNQNKTLSAGDLLYLVVASVGSPTAVADVAFAISYYEIGT